MANKGNYYIGIRLLLLKQYLEYNAGPDRVVTRKSIENFLKEEGFPVEKKTIYADLAVLGQVFGMKLDYDPHRKGYLLLNPSFNPYELRLLIDCVQASTFITEDEVKTITTKIRRLANEKDRTSLDRNIVVKDRVNRAEDSILRKVDIIHEALRLKRQISFRYFKYKAERIEHREYYTTCEEENRLIINPRKLVLENGMYYLDYYQTPNDYFDLYFHPRWFEVERMSDLQVLSEPIDTKELPDAHPDGLPPEIMNLVTGEDKVITIRFRNNFIQNVLDAFGHQTIIIPHDEHHFTINLKAKCNGETYMKIASFGCYAKVLSPPDAVSGFNRYIRDLTQLYDSDKEPEHVLSLEELDEIYMNDYYGYDLEELRSMVDWDELGIDPNDI